MSPHSLIMNMPLDLACGVGGKLVLGWLAPQVKKTARQPDSLPKYSRVTKVLVPWINFIVQLHLNHH